MILFQPCPHHFPDLWKVDTPTMPELRHEHLQTVRELYQFPDDDSEEAKLYFAPPSRLTEVYAKFWFQSAHGFLVDNGHLIYVPGDFSYFNSCEEMSFVEKKLQLTKECYERARTFSLPEKTPSNGWASNMGRGHTRRTVCLPCALDTWPPLT
jgi:hypothetical protein